MRHTHPGPGTQAVDDGSTEGIHARHNQAAAPGLRRGRLWSSPGHSSLWQSCLQASCGVQLTLLCDKCEFPIWLMVSHQEIVQFRVLHWKPGGEGRWRYCRWHSGPSWMAVVAVQLSWGREHSCAGTQHPESQAWPTCLIKGISSPKQTRQRSLLLQQADETSHCCFQWFYFSSFYIPNQVQNYTVECTKKHFQVQAERIINISPTLQRRI